jgi:hypothetical protein
LYYNENMGATVQVRLDKGAEAALEQLMRDNGWTASQAVRDSLLKVAEQQKPKPRPRLVGTGCVSFGPGDLATNKTRMRDFGAKSMGKGWRPPKDRAR